MSSDDDEYEPEYEPEDFLIADRYQVRLLAVVPPPLEYMMSLHSTHQEISGRKVWCGSLLLAHALVHIVDQEPTYLQDKRILELGSGTGLVGMVVSKLMHESGVIVLTDGDEEAMTLLRRNLDDPYNTIDPSRVNATFLRWNENLERFDSWCRCNNIISGGLHPPIENAKVEFDVILAGDVMYKEELPKLFFKMAQQYLTPTGVLWLCHVPRSNVTHPVVMKAAMAEGFSIVALDTTDLVVHDCPEDDLNRAIVYRITRKSSTGDT